MISRTTRPAGRVNRLVAAVLRSKAHWLLSRWVCLVCYEGRRSGRSLCTPTQYASSATGLVIFVGRHETKTWWRNFRGGADIDVLIAGDWRHLSADAVCEADDAERISPLLATYIDRYPRTAKVIKGDGDPDRTALAVVIHAVERKEVSASGEGTSHDHLVERET